MGTGSLDVRGAWLVFGSATAWSFGGAIARYLTVSDSWTVVFWRSVFAASFLLAFMLWQNGRKATVALFLAMGWPGVGVAACFALASTCFVVALAYTTVANVLLLQAGVPLALASIDYSRRLLTLRTFVSLTGVPQDDMAKIALAFDGVTGYRAAQAAPVRLISDGDKK